MKRRADIMGMPVTVEIVDEHGRESDIEEVFDYLRQIDNRFSPYRKDSEVERLNRKEINTDSISNEMNQILTLSEKTKKETNGFFDIETNGRIDPSGIVKGYAIHETAEILRKKKYKNFYIEIAGDIETNGLNTHGEKWRVGIKNPFNTNEIVKILRLSNNGIATSGNYIRGKHIYNPVKKRNADEIASLTVVGPNVYDADRFATAAFAMGEKGIHFIESLNGFEGYMITNDKQAIYTSGLDHYLTNQL